MSSHLKGELRHRIPGRFRVSLEHPLPDRQTLETLAGTLAGAQGVDEVEVRPQSGSVIVRHHGDYEDVVSALRRAGLQIENLPSHSGPSDPIQGTLHRIAAADTAVQRLTGGRTDIWGVSFSLLVLTGLVQLARGQVAGPALTLFGQAATLAMARPLKRFF